MQSRRRYISYVHVFQAIPVHRAILEVLRGRVDQDTLGLLQVQPVPRRLSVQAVPADPAHRCNQLCLESRSHPSVRDIQVDPSALEDLEVLTMN